MDELKRESGENPELPRSGKRERTSPFEHWLVSRVFISKTAGKRWKVGRTSPFESFFEETRCMLAESEDLPVSGAWIENQRLIDLITSREVMVGLKNSLQ